MNCYYHPKREAVGTCVSCGKPICAECKVVLGEKFYCNPCADKLFAGVSPLPEAKSLNWLQRHLNWTVILAIVASWVLAFIVGVFLVLIDPSITDEALGGVGYLIAILGVLLVAGWALRQKSRRLWWLLILFVPFGWIVFLCLENRSRLPELAKLNTNRGE